MGTMGHIVVMSVVTDHTLFGMTRLSVLVVSWLSADGCGISVVRCAHIVGSVVHGQDVIIVSGSSVMLLAKATHESLLAARARSVVVGWAGAIALLLAAVTNQSQLNKNGEDEEEAISISIPSKI